PSKAIDVLQEYLRRNPDNARVQRRLGEVLLDQGRIDDALEAFAKAEALNPDEPRIEQDRRTVALLRDQVASVESADRARLAAAAGADARRRAAADLANDLILRGRGSEARKVLAAASDAIQTRVLLVQIGQPALALSESRRMSADPA